MTIKEVAENFGQEMKRFGEAGIKLEVRRVINKYDPKTAVLMLKEWLNDDK